VELEPRPLHTDIHAVFRLAFPAADACRTIDFLPTAAKVNVNGEHMCEGRAKASASPLNKLDNAIAGKKKA